MNPFQIKICGITNRRDADWAIQCGADALGFNFFQQSSRSVPLEEAKQIASALPPEIVKVGIFVDHPIEEIKSIANDVGLDQIQLHGHETSDDVPPLAAHWPIIRAVRVPVTAPDQLDAIFDKLVTTVSESAKPWIEAGVASILLDAARGEQFGGTGVVFPWSIVPHLQLGVHTVLAGGLNPENIAEAISTAKPAAVDVASGVESHPGKKDADKMSRFITTAQNSLAALSR